jgi:C-terminal processing protease CtpA/Prc
MDLVPKSASEQRFATDQLRADFAALYEGLQQAHFNLFAKISRAEMDLLFADTLASFGRALTPLETKTLFQRFVAAGQVAHARIDFLPEAFVAFRETGGRGFPAAVRIDAGALYITQDLSGSDAMAPGDSIEELNAQPVANLLRRLRRNVSADNDYLAGALMEPQFGALLWLEYGAIDIFALRVRKADGRRVRVRVPALSREQMRANATSATATLQINPGERVARMLPSGVAYLRPGVFLNIEDGASAYDARPFHAFIDRALADFIAAGATQLLIDLRDNPGGDNSFSDHLVAWFATRPFRFCADFRVRVSSQAMVANAERLAMEPPDGPSHRFARAYQAASSGEIIHFDVPDVAPRPDARFEGRVCVLVNRRSYSNSVAFAALVQDYGFGSVLGEATADLATTYGSMERFTLPATSVSVGFPKAYIIRPNGDERVQGVTPDIPIRTPIVEPASDPVLQMALTAMSPQTP